MENNIFDDLAAKDNTPINQEQGQVQAPEEHVDPNHPIYPEQEESPVQEESQEKEVKPTPQESFQEMRQRNDKLQKERDEAVGTLKQIEEYTLQQQRQYQQQQQQQQQYEAPPVPDFPEYSDDDIIEGRHLKSEINRIKQEVSKYKKDQDQWLAVQRENSIAASLRSQHSDFDKVMTYENIKKLRELKPEIATALHQTPDIYVKASSTYTILKEMGIYKEDQVHPDHQRAQINSMKPRPVASVSPQRGDSPLSHANAFSADLTETDKRKIYNDMVANSRRR